MTDDTGGHTPDQPPDEMEQWRKAVQDRMRGTNPPPPPPSDDRAAGNSGNQGDGASNQPESTATGNGTSTPNGMEQPGISVQSKQPEFRTIRGGQQLTKYGVALLTYELYGKNIRYAIDAKQWQLWDGRAWLRSDALDGIDPNNPGVVDIDRVGVGGYIINTIRRLHEYTSEDAARAFGYTATLLKGSPSEIQNFLQEDPRIRVNQARFDADGYVLNAPNGIVDLRAGTIGPHRREALLSRMTGCEVDLSGKQPERFLKFLKEASCGRQEWVDLVLDLGGLTLIGDILEHIIPNFYGRLGRNGKSTYLNLFLKLMGTYGHTADVDLLLPRKGNANKDDIARLHGQRFVPIIELPKNMVYDERFVKSVVGGDQIVGRYLYHGEFSFHPVLTLYTATNYLPTVHDTSPAMWSRQLVIPWDNRLPEDAQIVRYENKLFADEGPLILGLFVERAWKYLNNGHKLKIPDCVRDATEDYRVRENDLGTYITQMIDDTGDRGDFITVAEVGNDFYWWCEDQGINPQDFAAKNKVIHEIARELGRTAKQQMVNGDRSVKIVGCRLRKSPGITGIATFS